ncbi:hypothetical protein FMN50_21820 [Rhodobacterales bacterium]|nr:hypothetical protein FMN50_21820 [Rhodobacterales bacterium]
MLDRLAALRTHVRTTGRYPGIVRLTRQAALAALVGCFAVQSASACMPGEPGDYDVPAADEALVVLATVKAYELRATANNVCSRTSYDVREVFWGEVDGTIDTEVCFPNDGEIEVADDGSFDRTDEMAEFESARGFYPGALVLAILTRQETPGRAIADLTSRTTFRQAITTCWGYDQIDVGVMKETEKAAVIETVRSQLKSLFHGGEGKGNAQ